MRDRQDRQRSDGIGGNGFTNGRPNTAEPIEMPFGFWARVGSVNHVLNREAHWRNLANTNEPSVSGGDKALSQITLTSGYYYYY